MVLVPHNPGKRAFFTAREALSYKLLNSAKSEVLLASIGKVYPAIDVHYKSKDKGGDNAKAYQPFST
jgi:hypothetical protein